LEEKVNTIVEVFNPVAVSEGSRIQPAPRPKELKNKRIGLHWNSKVNGDVALGRIAELLTGRFMGVEFKVFTSGVHSALKKEYLEEMQEWKPDAVIGSTAD
jgi:hypothetical protein